MLIATENMLFFFFVISLSLSKAQQDMENGSDIPENANERMRYT